MSKTMKNERIGEINKNKFGSIMVINKYKKYDDMEVYFPEYNWTMYNVSYKEFCNGHIKCPYEARYCGKGYLGEGPYSVMESKNIKSDSFIRWNSMLNRCYSGKYKSYENCYVCEDWLNYQNFANWYEHNYYEVNDDVMCLDKDILVKGNNLYSPDTCIFVPQIINTLFIKSDSIRGNMPIGVICKNGKYVSRCKKGNNEREYLGTFDTPEEAFYVYKEYKEQIIKEIADEYRDFIPFELYNAMYNYEININD